MRNKRRRCKWWINVSLTNAAYLSFVKDKIVLWIVILKWSFNCERAVQQGLMKYVCKMYRLTIRIIVWQHISFKVFLYSNTIVSQFLRTFEVLVNPEVLLYVPKISNPKGKSKGYWTWTDTIHTFILAWSNVRTSLIQAWIKSHWTPTRDPIN